MKPFHAILAFLALCYSCNAANAQHSRTQNVSARAKCDFRFLQEYDEILDAYFVHARGDRSSLVVARIYGGLTSEYEIVIDTELSRHNIFRYVPARAIHWNVYSLATPHLSVDQYKAEALKIPFTKTEFEIPEGQLQYLLSRAKKIDTSICEHLPLKDSKGRSNIVADGTGFEIITDSGNKRARVTDTNGSDLVNQNPGLLNWGVAMRDAFGVRMSDH